MDEHHDLSPISLTVVLPCYNEADRIEETIKTWAAFLSLEVSSHELLVVNDGSTDGSGRILDRLRREVPTLRVVHQLNGGQGAAVRRGYEESRGDFVLECDTNGRYSPEDLLRLWRYRKDFELVLSTPENPRLSLRERFYLATLRTATRLFFGCPWNSPAGSLRLFSRRTLEPHLGLLPRTFSHVNLGLTCLIYASHPDGITEVPVPYRSRSGPSRLPSFFGLVGPLFHITLDLIHLRLQLLRPSRLQSAHT